MLSIVGFLAINLIQTEPLDSMYTITGNKSDIVVLLTIHKMRLPEQKKMIVVGQQLKVEFHQLWIFLSQQSTSFCFKYQLPHLKMSLSIKNRFMYKFVNNKKSVFSISNFLFFILSMNCIHKRTICQ